MEGLKSERAQEKMKEDMKLRKAVNLEVRNLSCKGHVSLFDRTNIDLAFDFVREEFPGKAKNKELIENALTQTVDDRVKLYLKRSELAIPIKMCDQNNAVASIL